MVTFSICKLLACAKEKLWRKALELLHEMEEKGIAPTAVIYRYEFFSRRYRAVNFEIAEPHGTFLFRLLWFPCQCHNNSVWKWWPMEEST